MVFIFGGAYQGKTDFAKEAFSLSEGDIFSCSGTEIDFSRRCVDNIESFHACLYPRGDRSGRVFPRAPRRSGKESIFICRDMFAALCRWGAETARMAAGYRTAYAISEPRGRACEPHFLPGLEQRLK